MTEPHAAENDAPVERCTRAVGLPCPTHGLSHWRGPKDHNYWRLLAAEVFGE